MKVGDLIKSNTRYKGQLMMVIDTRTNNGLFGNFQQIRVVCMNSGIKMRWSRSTTWEVISGK
jgi:hypothetical protein